MKTKQKKQKRKVHFVPDDFDPQTICGPLADRNIDTEDPKKVTCKRCKKMLYTPPSQRWGAK